MSDATPIAIATPAPSRDDDDNAASAIAPLLPTSAPPPADPARAIPAPTLDAQQNHPKSRGQPGPEHAEKERGNDSMDLDETASQRREPTLPATSLEQRPHAVTAETNRTRFAKESALRTARPQTGLSIVLHPEPLPIGTGPITAPAHSSSFGFRAIQRPIHELVRKRQRRACVPTPTSAHSFTTPDSAVVLTVADNISTLSSRIHTLLRDPVFKSRPPRRPRKTAVQSSLPRPRAPLPQQSTVFQAATLAKQKKSLTGPTLSEPKQKKNKSKGRSGRTDKNPEKTKKDRRGQKEGYDRRAHPDSGSAVMPTSAPVRQAPQPADAVVPISSQLSAALLGLNNSVSQISQLSGALAGFSQGVDLILRGAWPPAPKRNRRNA